MVQYMDGRTGGVNGIGTHWGLQGVADRLGHQLFLGPRGFERTPSTPQLILRACARSAAKGGDMLRAREHTRSNYPLPQREQQQGTAHRALFWRATYRITRVVTENLYTPFRLTSRKSPEVYAPLAFLNTYNNIPT